MRTDLLEHIRASPRRVAGASAALGLMRRIGKLSRIYLSPMIQ